MAKIVVDVMLKPEIHDPQGEAIAGACHRLGFTEVVAVRQGKRVEVEIADAVDAADSGAAGIAQGHGGQAARPRADPRSKAVPVALIGGAMLVKPDLSEIVGH